MTEPMPYELSVNDLPKCPWCGHDNSDDDMYGTDGQEYEMDCAACDKPFIAMVEYSRTYDTRKPPNSAGTDNGK